MMSIKHFARCLGSVYALAGLSAGVCAAGEAARFDADGAMLKPADGYREWVYLGTPLTPNDMNGGKAAFPEFHIVYMDPESWAYWKKTGEFRDGTVILKELAGVGGKKSFSGNGYFMGEYLGLEAMVKDRGRFKDKPGNWAFFRFTNDNFQGLKEAAKAMPDDACAACHQPNAGQDLVFTQHYPVLRAGKPAR